MGVDHVGLGSDFDGISVLPRPMKDATSLPLVGAGLLKRGYSDGEVAKILGENFLRVLG
jgi:membrane dipeptidase